MLDKAFQRRFFEQATELNTTELDQRIEQVQALAKTFSKGSEAALDSRFLLRHMRRIRAERLFSQQATPKH